MNNAEKLDRAKCGLFSERRSADEVQEWILAALPPESHTAALTGALMMWNTAIEIAKQITAEEVES